MTAEIDSITPIAAIGQALSDPTRIRLLLALRGGELCLCHLVELVDMAPSTVSKHMQLLHRAGLVQRHKEGRWVHFRLAGRDADPVAAGALRWIHRLCDSDESLKRTREAIADEVCCIRPC